MIEGTLNDRMEPVVAVRVVGATELEQRLAAVVDTGFSGFLTIPEDVAADLSLLFNGMARVVLADDSEVYMRMYTATVLWDGVPRTIVAHASPGVPLIGVGMLVDHSLHINFEPAGDVLVGPLA